MINGAKMKKTDVVKWLADNNYDSVNGFGYCSIMVDNLKDDGKGVQSADIYAILVGCFAEGASMFRRMTCDVTQFITLERLN